MKGALLMLVLFSLCFHGEYFTCEALLPQQEIDALKVIAAKLKMPWNFSVDPCSGKDGWVQTYDPSVSKFIAKNLTCHCDPNTSVCHVTSIQLKELNLTGVLPTEFANLTHLTFLDLSRNYLSGTIPAEWGSLPLTNLTLLGNRISGRIPDELGNISTLQSLVIDANQLEGPIPATLGKLTMLTRLFIAANNFSGELPESLGNLKNMSNFIMDGNPISGKIPAFISNWTQLQRLDMQGTSLEGPFPPNFANLSSITQLRVSDMRGVTDFPPLENMKKMHQLVLRNLSISDQIPIYIGGMTDLYSMDLTFNNLSGNIPASLGSLPKASYMYLSNNKLNQNVPEWMLLRGRNVDISYNNFTGDPSISDCPDGPPILTSIFSSTNSNSISPCLRKNYPCPEKPTNYKLFINCGGSNVIIDGNEYEDDSAPSGASRFHSVGNKWAMSSIGLFTDNSNANYIATNTTVLNMSDPDLYTKARLCPLSLRYYGLCLQKGFYNVSLHFAEIIFIDDKSYFSVGKRLFDVFIQGKKVLQDFDIVKEANGTGKEVIKSFNISVDGTLEIHLYWAGKGTNTIPQRGVYGPLISAISVINYNPVLDSDKLSVGAILGIIAGACAAILLISIIVWICRRRKYVLDSELRGLELQTSTFTLKQIKVATNNFDNVNKIGEGGFGPVYKGVLPDGSEIAVKQLSSKSKQGNREFINEIGMISALHHPNLVKLYGCGIEGNLLLLVYEYMENNSLARALFGPERTRVKLDWQTRYKICIGIAKGLTFLHEESRIKIVHRDIKGTNILLDKKLNAKISDFGLAKLDEEENSHISTRVAGTRGYMAPEYALRGYLTDKADVYSYGVVLLEIVSGMSNTSYKPKDEYTYLLDWAQLLEAQGKLIELVDPKLGPNYSMEEALLVLNMCIKCTNPNPSLRPPMSTVVSILEGGSPMWVPSLGSQDSRFVNPESRTQSISTDGLYSESSMSVPSTKEEKMLISNSIPSDTSGVSTSLRLLDGSDS